MVMTSTAPGSVDDYIAACAPNAQAVMRKIRSLVKRTAPKAEEVISYRMPAFKQNGVLLYYAAFKEHIGLFPPVKGDAALLKALARYSGPKGNLRLPLDEPMPYDLIRRIVELRVKQNGPTARASRAKTQAGAKTAKAKSATARLAKTTRARKVAR
jgi:uncharacterized protein YdhG (YjbR/CyaY superfamily)